MLSCAWPSHASCLLRSAEEHALVGNALTQLYCSNDTGWLSVLFEAAVGGWHHGA